MSELDALRDEIDTIDAELSRLFVRRMEVTEQVGEYKKENGLPILNAEREKQVLAEKAAENPAYAAELTELYGTILRISRRQQGRLTEDGGWPLPALRTPVTAPRVAYQGVPGAYSEAAVRDFFGEEAEAIGLPQFESVFRALRDGSADYGVVPIENSATGAIRQIYELLTRYDGFLVGETTVRVAHCLMAPAGASLDTIRQVFSHEQGLFQCEPFLNGHPGWKRTAYSDTAGSARFVAERGDPTLAAIASERAASLYGLRVLARDISSDAGNTTRFVVVSPVPELRPGSDKISAVFTLPHRCGSLHEILALFSEAGSNLLRIESRPILGRSWEYLFFLEFSGQLSAPALGKLLRRVSETAENFRILGNFPSNL